MRKRNPSKMWGIDPWRMRLDWKQYSAQPDASKKPVVFLLLRMLASTPNLSMGFSVLKKTGLSPQRQDKWWCSRPQHP